MADVFVNTAFAQVTESAATTLTYSQVQTGISLFDKIAWKIERIEWYWGNPGGQLVSNADYMQAALTVSNKMTGLSLDDPAVIDMMEWHVNQQGTAASSQLFTLPFIRDFTDLSGGGLLMPANPVFLAAQGVSIAAAQTISARIRYTMVELKDAEYIELVQNFRFVE